MPQEIVLRPGHGIFIPPSAKRRVLHEGDITEFSFRNEINDGVELDFRNEDMIKYFEALAAHMGSAPFLAGVRQHEIGVQRESLDLMIQMFLEKALPEYFDKGFYHVTDLSPAWFGKNNRVEGGGVLMFHPDAQNERAYVRVNLHSVGNFLPRIEGGALKRPTIDFGTLEGHVFINAKLEVDERLKFDREPTAAVIYALVYGTELDYKSSGIGKSITAEMSGIAAKVSNPTLDRIKEAIACGEEISAFFEQNKQALGQVALAFREALDDYSLCTREVRANYGGLAGAVKMSQERLGRGIPMPGNVDTILAEIGNETDRRLIPANSTLRSLAGSFPKSLRKYLPQAQTSMRLLYS